MSTPKKIKLDSRQEKRLKVLKKHLELHNCWHGDQDLREVMLDGSIVVLGVRAPIFNTAVACDSVDNARAVCKYNPDAHTRVLDLDTGKVLWEEEKGWVPRTAR
jgi:hypothetical protein